MRFLLASLLLSLFLTSCNQDYRKLVPISWKETATAINVDSLWIEEFTAKNSSGQLNPGFTRNYWWVKAQLHNPNAQPQSFYVLLNNPHLNRVEVYFNHSSSNPLTLGDEFPFKERPLRYRDFAIPIVLGAKDSLSLLLKIDKRGESLQLNMQFIEQSFFVEEVMKEHLAMGMNLGWMLLIAIFLFILWIKLKDHSTLFYALYVLSISFWMLSNWGLGFQWLWPCQVAFASKARPFFITLSMIFFILSLLSFFPKQQHLFKFRRLLISVVGSCVFFLFLLLFIGNSNISIFGKQFFLVLNMITVGLCLLFSAWFIFLNLRNKLSDFKYYGFGLVFLIISSASLIVLQFGASLPLQNLINTYGTGISLIGETTIIAFGFTRRFEQYRRDRERLASELLIQQQTLAENLILAQEDERKRIGRDLHDSIGGLLSAAFLRLEKISSDFQNLQLEHLKKLISQSIREVRSISQDLVPPNLAEFGLKNALVGQVDLLTEESNCKILFFYDVKTTLNLSTQTVIYRIVNELIGNALKHAEANEISLELVEENNLLQIVVEDNGKGFNGAEKKAGLGLKNIEYRVQYLKGTWNIDTNSEGTTIIVEIPVK